MSEEEKQDIIQFLRCFCKTTIDYCKLEKEDVLEILNYIDKLQKEIQKLKEIKQTCYEDIDNIRNEYDKEIEEYKKQIDLEFVEENYIEKSKVVSKNKIRAKIKELEERNKMFKLELPEDVTIYLYVIEVLKELLGE